MTSSGTYSYNPSAGNLLLAAYARIGLRRPALTAEHMLDGANEANFLLSEWSSKQPLLWKSELVSVPLTQGVATYVLDANIVMLLIVTLETNGTDNPERVLGPLSTVEYQAIPNKTQQAPPTSFWFDRQITPQITFWQTPDGNGPYVAQLRCVTQVQDASLPGGTTMDIPYRALDAFTAGLAHRLARIHAPALEAQRKQDAMEAWDNFSGNDIENVGLFLIPGLGAYRW